MSKIMMGLGNYRFSLNTSVWQELRRNTSSRWQTVDRLHRLPARQYLGPGEDVIDIDGVVYPESIEDVQQFDDLRKQAGRGEPLQLVDGLGYVWGQWVVLQVNEKRMVLAPNGQPRKLSFTMRLARYGEDVSL